MDIGKVEVRANPNHAKQPLCGRSQAQDFTVNPGRAIQIRTWGPPVRFRHKCTIIRLRSSDMALFAPEGKPQH